MTPNPSASCPQCGRPLPDGARYCPGCGSEAPRFAVPTIRSRPLPGNPLPESSDSSSRPRILVALALLGIGIAGLFAASILILAGDAPGTKAGQTDLAQQKPISSLPAGVRIPPSKSSPDPFSPPRSFPTRDSIGDPAATQGAPTSSRYQILESDRFGFSFEVPADWQYESRDDTLFFSPPDDSPDSKSIWGDVQVIGRRPGATLADQAAALKRQLKEFKNVAIAYEEAEPFHGLPAHYLVCTYHQEAAERDYIGIWIIAEREPRFFYWLSFHLDSESYEALKPIVGRAVETFVLNPIPQP